MTSTHLDVRCCLRYAGCLRREAWSLTGISGAMQGEVVVRSFCRPFIFAAPWKHLHIFLTILKP